MAAQSEVTGEGSVGGWYIEATREVGLFFEGLGVLREPAMPGLYESLEHRKDIRGAPLNVACGGLSYGHNRQILRYTYGLTERRARPRMGRPVIIGLRQQFTRADSGDWSSPVLTVWADSLEQRGYEGPERPERVPVAVGPLVTGESDPYSIEISVGSSPTDHRVLSWGLPLEKVRSTELWTDGQPFVDLVGGIVRRRIDVANKIRNSGVNLFTALAVSSPRPE